MGEALEDVITGIRLPKPRGGNQRITLRSGGMVGGVSPRLGMDVSGFSATMEQQVVGGLPGGVHVPADTLDLLEDAETVLAWLATGRNLEVWCEQEGHEGLTWVDEDGNITVPDEVADSLPEEYRHWVEQAPEAVAALRRLRQEV